MTSYVEPPTFIPVSISSANDINLISQAIKALWVGTTAGDIEYFVNATTKARLGIGSANKILCSDGSVPVWKSETELGIWVGTTLGDMEYYSDANTKVRLPIGAANQILSSNGTIPVWKYEYQLPSWVGTTAGDMEYCSSATAKTRIPIGTEGYVLAVVAGVPAWKSVGTLPTAPTKVHASTGSTSSTNIVSSGAWKFISAAKILDSNTFLNADPATHFRVSGSTFYGQYSFTLTARVTSAASDFGFGISSNAGTATATLIANTERTYEAMNGTMLFTTIVNIQDTKYYAPIMKNAGTFTLEDRYWHVIKES